MSKTARPILSGSVDAHRKRELTRHALLNVIEATLDAVIVVDTDQSIILWNRAATGIFGYQPEDIIGKPFSVLIPSQHYPMYQQHVQASLSGVSSNKAAPTIIRCVRRSGAEFTAEVARSLDHSNGPGYVAIVLRDITPRLVARRQNAHRLAIVATLADSVVSVDADGIVETWNESAEKLTGYSSDTAISQPLINLEMFDDCPVTKARHTGDTIRQEMTLRASGGKEIPVSVTATPMYGLEGSLLGVSAIISDNTRRKQRDDHMRFVMMELAHRAKNLLTVIASMARSTAENCSSIEEFQEKYIARIHSFSYSHDLLLKENWAGADLENLFKKQLRSFVEQSSDRLKISGPSIMLNPQGAQMLGLAMHELATNAAKYGALSTSSGIVEVEWRLIESSCDQGAQVLELTWIESGGPEVSAPSNQGFGLMVIDDMIAQTLDADVALEFARTGLRWIIRAPIGVWRPT